MSNRIIIKSVKIKNFRSIRNEIIEAKNMNIFVGLNDVGKSNFLKALNLFFNGQTDYGVPFDFKKDFTNLFPEASHSTKEIVIEIKFIIPDTYKEKGVFTWKKTWRINDYVDESILNENGEKPSGRSRIPGTLKRIKYRYVPAVKSKEYYKSLLSDLYFTVSAVLDSPLEESVKNFSKVLQEYTLQISSQVNERIGIDSKLSIPDNLSELFKTLIFQTNNSENKKIIPLDMRGDGIQARHIPIILKYIADEDKKTRNQGSMKVANIWGFEEPENGVELSKAFDMAKDFFDFSEEIQMFITTHSPAFYMNKDSAIKINYVIQGEKNEGTKIKYNENGLSIGHHMGLMPIVAPYIADQDKKIAEAKRIIDENVFVDIPTIMVEGKTDKQYLELAIELFSEKLSDAMSQDKLRIFTKDGQGGCKQMINWAYAWIYSGNLSKAVILFDKDKAGINAKKELCDSTIFKNKRADAMISVKFYEPSDNVICVYKKDLDLNFEVEHLLSYNCWEKMKEKDYVEPKDEDELYNMVKKFFKIDKSVDVILDEIIDNYNLRSTIVTLNPKKDKKDQICKLVCLSNSAEKKGYMEGFIRTIKELEKWFG